MGDVGSATLGFTFATLPVLAFAWSGNPRVFAFGVLAVAPFVFDTAVTLCRRAKNGEHVFEAHRSHLYQRLVRSGYSHGAVSAAHAGLALVTGGLGLAYLRAGTTAGALWFWTSMLVLCGWALLVTRAERTAARP
jgi:UDP-N-acetylmuramyl pentapeptide phosphotransferase/UDP-N-acetylglucosamine-1-phosphate transferase